MTETQISSPEGAEPALERAERNPMIAPNNAERKFTTKAGLASRYDVGIRTIGEWQRLGLLAFFKIKRVVRFDVTACDENLRQYGYDV
jgi:hypothetical protein